MTHAELKTFGFAGTAAAQKFVHGIVGALARAAEAGLIGAPSYPAYAPALAQRAAPRR